MRFDDFQIMFHVSSWLVKGLFTIEGGTDAATGITVTLNFPGTARMTGTFTEAMNEKGSAEFRQVQHQFCSQVGHVQRLIMHTKL